MGKGWDNGMLKKLKSLVGKGLSTAEMGKKLGMSKNAVVGKLNRLGWNAKGSDAEPQKTSKTNKTKTVSKTAEKAAAKKVVVEKKSKTTASVKKPVKESGDSSKKKTVAKTKDVQKPAVKTASKKSKKDLALHELLIQHALQMANLKQNQCRWPIGDPDSENFHFCGETVFAGKPYCYEHCRQAYQLTPPKKK